MLAHIHFLSFALSNIYKGKLQSFSSYMAGAALCPAIDGPYLISRTDRHKPCVDVGEVVHAFGKIAARVTEMVTRIKGALGPAGSRCQNRGRYAA